jgi:hypothetical protein
MYLLVRPPKLVIARPCRHCNSGKHWNNEYHHSIKGERMARVNHIWLEDDDVRAQEDYNNLFYELNSDAERESTQQDFCRPLQHSDSPDQPNNPNLEKLEGMLELKVLTCFWVQKLFSHWIPV